MGPAAVLCSSKSSEIPSPVFPKFPCRAGDQPWMAEEAQVGCPQVSLGGTAFWVAPKYHNLEDLNPFLRSLTWLWSQVALNFSQSRKKTTDGKSQHVRPQSKDPFTSPAVQRAGKASEPRCGPMALEKFPSLLVRECTPCQGCFSGVGWNRCICEQKGKHAGKNLAPEIFSCYS